MPPIDPNTIQWDAAPAIDPRTIQWDAAPAGKQYSWGEVPSAAIKNVGPSAQKFYGALVQAASHPIDTLKSLGQTVGGGIQAAMPKSVQDWLIKNAYDPEKLKQSMAMAREVGGMYAERYGSEDGLKRAIAEDPVGVAADLSSLLNLGAAAAGRAGLTTTSSVLAKAGTVTNPLAPVGVAARGVQEALSKGGTIVESVFNPKNALYIRAAEGQAPQIINALRSAKEIVPGSAPTAAQAAADTGVVGFQKLGKSAAGVLETEYKSRELQQKAAQLQQVQRVGKTPQDIAIAEGKREAVTKPMYELADKTLSKVDAEFTALQNRPSMNKVIARAQNLAQERGVPFQIGKTTPEVRTPSVLVDDMGRPLGETVTPAQYAELPGTSIHFMKQAFDDLINDPATFGIGKSDAAAIAETRKLFLDWVNQTSKNPAYAQARETFAKMSAPINQMQVAQFLERKLTPVLGEETAALRGAAYATALDEAAGTVKKGTQGASRFKTLEDVFKDDPDALQALRAVRADIERQAKSQFLAKGPVKRELDATRASEALDGDSLIPQMVNRTTTIANDLWRRLRGKVDQTTALEVAAEMLVPEKAADALAKALKQYNRRQIIKKAAAAPAQMLYATPAMVNMMAPNQERQNALAP